jgi:hypothetical protein
LALVGAVLQGRLALILPMAGTGATLVSALRQRSHLALLVRNMVVAVKQRMAAATVRPAWRGWLQLVLVHQNSMAVPGH